MLARTVSLAGLLLLVAVAPAAGQAAPKEFPRGFLWGTASAGFQVEAGGSPANADRRSDWWAFTTDRDLIRDGLVSGDKVTRGPGFWRKWRGDLDRARGRLSNNSIRLGMEWSRIFPRSTARVSTGTRISRAELRRLDRLANKQAVRRYRAIFRGARRRGLEPMVTLNHFTLPVWINDPARTRRAFAGRGPDDPVPAGLRRSGWLEGRTVGEFRKYAAYVAWKFGADVDLWATVNEPMVTASQGFVSIPGVTGVKAPAVLNYPAAVRVFQNLALANAAAYDAVHARDRRARVGFVHNLVDWKPADPNRARDVEATRNADQIFNRTFPDAVIHGYYDKDVDGVRDPGELRRRLRGKADFFGVNHYSPGRVTGLAQPVSRTVPLFDFQPSVTYRTAANPNGPPCPTRCTDFGWEIDPAGFRRVIEQADSYDKPIYITENGIDDSEDDQRPDYLTGYLTALQQAIAGGADVRGYYHWSLLDNYEWAEGFEAHFGLYGYNPRTLRRTERASARLYGRIARANELP